MSTGKLHILEPNHGFTNITMVDPRKTYVSRNHIGNRFVAHILYSYRYRTPVYIDLLSHPEVVIE